MTTPAGRQVGWTELFFDLVFVVTVAKLAHYLEHDPGPASSAGSCCCSWRPGGHG